MYAWQQEERKDSEKFILHDGPPYANGQLHVGHALNKVLKDMIVRSELQQGKQVRFVPGWDCHGLPIEHKALLELRAKDGGGEQKLDAVGVRKIARALAEKTVVEQKQGFKEWGVMADWDSPYLTLNKEFELKQLGVFLEMTKQGLIFRRYKPVYWSPSSKSALAEAELEYNDKHKSTAAFVKFQILEIPESLKAKGIFKSNLHAVIWTTTPWTLPANKAIGFHRDLDYAIVQIGQEQLIFGKNRLDHIIAKCKLEDTDIKIVLETISGSELEGITYRNTLRGSESSAQPLLFADFVTGDAGTGLVHMAPGFGMEDYELCTKHGIPAFAPVDDSGCFTDEALPENPALIQGKAVLGDGNAAILELLGSKILGTHPLEHKYPYDWRTKLPVIVRATAQWFADVGSIKDTAMKSLESVKFIPETGRPRLESFVKNRSEWCISRQRAWGVPIPALYLENGDAVLTEESVSHIIATVEERGIDAWWTDAEDDAAWIPVSHKGQSLRRGRDTMDVWFDSGTSWTQTPEVADVYCEGTDQHRGWFQSSLLTHVSASGLGCSPFKKLVTHGFTLDKDGRKMSKSVGNVIAPSQIIDGTILPLDPPKKRRGQPKHPAGQPYYDALGPDALRLWVASSDYTTDVILGENVFANVRRILIRYRNTIKMMFSNLHEETVMLPPTKRDIIALYQLQQAQLAVAAAYKNYDFHKAVEIINNWLSVDFSTFYSEAVKDRMYCGDGGSVMYPLYMGFMHMLSPILPGLVEESWEHRPEWMKQSNKIPHPLHVATSDLRFLKVGFSKDHPREIAAINAAKAAVNAAQEIGREKKQIGSSLQVRVLLDVPKEAKELLAWYDNELEDIFVVSNVAFGSGEGVNAEWVYKAAFETEGGSATAWVLPAENHKCGRCWKYQAEEEDSLCKRCDDVVNTNFPDALKSPESLA